MSITSLKIKLNEKIYLRDPQETELGKKILSESLKIIYELGFEHFTFKKLAARIDSTEASIYRYFESKYKLLIYLISWYWVWLDYCMAVETRNITSSEEKLRIFVRLLTQLPEEDLTAEIDTELLYKIVINETPKVFLTKEVDNINKEGIFKEYKRFCSGIADLIKEVNPGYRYTHSLVSMLVEASRQQLFFAQHLPSLTDIQAANEEKKQLTAFLEEVLFTCIKKK